MVFLGKKILRNNAEKWLCYAVFPIRTPKIFGPRVECDDYIENHDLSPVFSLEIAPRMAYFCRCIVNFCTMHTSPKSLHSSTQPPPLPLASVYSCRLNCIYPVYTVAPATLATYCHYWHTFPHIPAYTIFTIFYQYFQPIPPGGTLAPILCIIDAYLLRCTVVCLQLVHCACIYNSCTLAHCLPGAPALPAVVLVLVDLPGHALPYALPVHRAFSCPYNVPVTI